ncbi:GPI TRANSAMIDASE COMPONENT PIG-U [Salix viminalis]|uniref:GPI TRANSAMIDASE COMPONENT PIG-U n=1 Tax=Salix viminalis TaxID=40686 RepID=A0A9Q0TMP6_SALVM|nr:GPI TRANSAMIDASE COMPONENT PIG-U [Salix viminalis]
MEKKKRGFWRWLIASVMLRLILIYLPKTFNLASRPEISTPLVSLRRLAEGYWLKKSSMSPYAGSMYHGSPLLLSLLGPLTVKRIEGQPDHLLCSLVFVIADIISALLIRATGHTLQMAYRQSLNSLDIVDLLKSSDSLSSGDVAALVYLWNPFTIAACVGLSTSPVENLVVILALHGACKARFGGWVKTIAPWKTSSSGSVWMGYGDTLVSLSCNPNNSSDSFVGICISVKPHGSLWEMFQRTYGFILTVEDMSPNIGVLWYFFAEVFDFFRSFFMIVFHLNILFMILPLAIRLKHRPCFLAFIYIAISSMLKSYPSGLFLDELADMQFSFFLLCGYIGVSLLSPVMHNLWIWRGTGNANFYYATGMAYACLQIILVVESVSAVLNHDRKLRKLSVTKLRDGNS